MNELKVNYPMVDLSDAQKLLSQSDFTIADIGKTRKELEIAARRVDVLAIIGGATEKNPKSATILIQNPTFEKSGVWKVAYDLRQVATWFLERYHPLYGQDAALDKYAEIAILNYNYAADCYPSLKSALGNGEFYNTLVGLPNGRYVIECDAAATNTADDVPSDLITGVYLFVRSSGFETLTPIKTEGLVPKHFSNEFYISSGDTIYFGIKTTNTTANRYVTDNYTLTYYGETDKDAYHGTLMSRLKTIYQLYPDLETLCANPQLKQAFDETLKESDITIGDYVTEEYSTAMKQVERQADALHRSVVSYINAALLRQLCERERNYYEGTEYTDLADQLGDLGMCLESGYQDCNLDELLMESYHLTIGEVYDYIQNLIAEATGIEELASSRPSPQGKGAIFNLQGQRISQNSVFSVPSVLPKGVYIVNGKKILVK
jgi:hypothetical protein